LRFADRSALARLLAQGRDRVVGSVADYFAATSAAREFRRQGRDYLEVADRLAAASEPQRTNQNGRAGLPRALFVISTQVGGTPQTNQDLMTALAERYETYVLRSDARTVILTRWRAGQHQTLRHVRLPAPIQPFPHVDRNYDRLLAGWLAEYGFDLLHIRHVAWHSLSLPRLAKSFGIPVVFSFHDFYTMCPTVRLVDENGVFCGGACTATAGQCRHELWKTKNFPPLKNAAVFRWREAMAAMLTDCDAFVTTSSSTRERIQRFFPQTLQRPFEVIEHGRDFSALSQVGHRPAPGERVRVLVPGNISATKGAHILKELRALDPAHQFEFHVLGKPSKALEGLPGVVCHGPYDRARFSEMVGEINPHFGAVLSIWAETFCHTLTEMWACGLPVVAFDLGAVADRIRRHGGGWLVRPVTAQAAYQTLLSIASDESDMARQLAKVAAWQQEVAPGETTGWMAGSYDQLYRELLAQPPGTLAGQVRAAASPEANPTAPESRAQPEPA
jgi:glycosyltransferase involved in cell wall biosynthesis